jgi:hypothetical protein
MTNYNIKPCWWGPNFWYSIFSIAATYPDKPDPKIIESTKNYFISLKLLLPCEGCRNSYATLINQADTNINNNNIYSSRNNLIEFIYNLRNKINSKLEIEYDLNLNYVKKKINKMAYNNNNMDGYINTLHEAPLISEKIIKKVLNYLKQNKYDVKETIKIIDKCKKFIDNPDFNYDNIDFKFFYKRNNICYDIIKKINLNISYYNYDIIQSFKKDNNLYLKLLYLGCSIIPTSDLDKLISNNF